MKHVIHHSGTTFKPINALAMRFLIVLLSLLGINRQLAAQELDIDYGRDGLILGGSLLGAYLMTWTPVDTDARWKSELLGAVDLRVRDNFSPRAARLADVLVATTMAVPLLQLASDGLEQEDGRRALLYTESLGVGLLVNAVVKFVVQRPRPYIYSRNARVAAYAREEGKYSHTSFYSGHSSLAFSAASAGTYLFALQSSSENKRALMSMLQFSLATATANLRVRAGKHYYSDVIVGALAGSLIGYAVPALHADSGVYKPSVPELAGMAGGVLVGALASEMIALGHENDRFDPISSVQLLAMPYPDGGGFALVGPL